MIAGGRTDHGPLEPTEWRDLRSSANSATQQSWTTSRVLETCALIQSARVAKNDFDTKGSAEFCVAVRGMIKTKFLRASSDSLPMSTSNFYQCQYCANCRSKYMSWPVCTKRSFAKASV